MTQCRNDIFTVVEGHRNICANCHVVYSTSGRIHGWIQDRLANRKFRSQSNPKKSPTPYVTYMKKVGITVEEVIEKARSQGRILTPDSIHFLEVTKRKTKGKVKMGYETVATIEESSSSSRKRERDDDDEGDDVEDDEKQGISLESVELGDGESLFGMKSPITKPSLALALLNPSSMPTIRLSRAEEMSEMFRIR
jgi:disulfide oxidoreductase YuzD